MTIKVQVAFDGTNYCGSQIQRGKKTIFEEFQNALFKIIGHKTDIKGCSRTDSGVHAKCYIFSFSTDIQVNLRKFPFSLNSQLPKDIRAVAATLVQDDFHARYDAKEKEYTYYIKNSHTDSPFCEKYYHRVPLKLDVDKMHQAAQYFIGKHDFTSFMSKASKIVDCTRTVTFCKVEQKDDIISFVIRADGYLYNMVRIMVGTLIDAGLEKIKPQDIKTIIEAKNRSNAGVTVAAKGLFLTDVFY